MLTDSLHTRLLHFKWGPHSTSLGPLPWGCILMDPHGHVLRMHPHGRVLSPAGMASHCVYSMATRPCSYPISVLCSHALSCVWERREWLWAQYMWENHKPVPLSTDDIGDAIKISGIKKAPDCFNPIMVQELQDLGAQVCVERMCVGACGYVCGSCGPVRTHVCVCVCQNEDSKIVNTIVRSSMDGRYIEIQS